MHKLKTHLLLKIFNDIYVVKYYKNITLTDTIKNQFFSKRI